MNIFDIHFRSTMESYPVHRQKLTDTHTQKPYNEMNIITSCNTHFHIDLAYSHRRFMMSIAFAMLIKVCIMVSLWIGVVFFQIMCVSVSVPVMVITY